MFVYIYWEWGQKAIVSQLAPRGASSLSHVPQNNLKISASMLLLTAAHQTHTALHTHTHTPSCGKKAHKPKQERDKNAEATRDNRRT